MPRFSFEAVTDAGARTRGVERAESEAAVAQQLEARGLHVLTVREDPPERAGVWRAGRRRRDVLELTRALASLLPAGLPLAKALDAARGVTGDQVRDALDDVKRRVERGESLADALRAWPELFPPTYTGLVHAGERAGDVASSFTRLAAQLERSEQLRGRILAATLYPALLAVAGTVAIVLLLVVVLPRFATLLEDAGAALPPVTRFLLTVSSVLGTVWPLLLAAPVLLGALITSLRRTESGRRTLARTWLSLPLVRTLRRQILAARITRLLAALIGGGAPVYVALGDVAATIGDPIARDIVHEVRERVRAGASLSAAFSTQAIVPPLVPQLVGIGEASAQLDTFLVKTADLLDERTERTAQRLATLAEPVLIVVLGAVVAMIAWALLQAIYGINAGAFA
jgi:type II secretory pathway component PulF